MTALVSWRHWAGLATTCPYRLPCLQLPENLTIIEPMLDQQSTIVTAAPAQHDYMPELHSAMCQDKWDRTLSALTDRQERWQQVFLKTTCGAHTSGSRFSLHRRLPSASMWVSMRLVVVLLVGLPVMVVPAVVL